MSHRAQVACLSSYLSLDFRGLLNVNFYFYNKKGANLLANAMGVPTEGFGFSTCCINNGEMLNHCIELALSGELYRSKG